MNSRPARALLTLGFLSCLPLTSFAEQDVQTRFEQALKEAQSLGKVEIECLDTLWMPHGFGTNRAEFCRTFQYSYVASGLKYRAACKLVSGTQTNLAKLGQSAFDGNSYWDYNADNQYMTRGKTSPLSDRAQSTLNPLVAPFKFLTKQSVDGLPQLRFTDIISPQWTHGFVLPPGQKSGGLLELSIPGLQLTNPPIKWMVATEGPNDSFAPGTLRPAPRSLVTNPPTTWKVAIDESGDSFTPKTISQLSHGAAGGEMVYRLLNYTNLGAYRFPTRIEWASSSPPFLATGVVTLISARIPGELADSLFRLDDEEKSAAVVWDRDKKTFLKSAQTDLDSQTTASTQVRANIYDESADGSKQITDALAAASKEHKHVLLQFGANWCSWCHKLHKLFQTDQSVRQELEKSYVVVMVDVNTGHNGDVNKKYENPTRFGLPAIVVLDADGQQLTTQNTGELEEADRHSPEKVTAFLKKWGPK